MALVLCISSAFADDWKFLYESDGLSVSKFRDPVTGLQRFKAEGVMEINFFEMVAVLTDIPRRVEWVTHLSEVALIEGKSAIQGVIYNVFDLPWPASDREMIVEAIGTACPVENCLTIEFQSVQRADLPIEYGRVRIPYTRGRNYLKYLDPTHTEVCFEVQVDPGGCVPKWIANYFAKDAPIRTLKVLKEQTMRTRDQSVVLATFASLVSSETE